MVVIPHYKAIYYIKVVYMSIIDQWIKVTAHLNISRCDALESLNNRSVASTPADMTVQVSLHLIFSPVVLALSQTMEQRSCNSFIKNVIAKFPSVKYRVSYYYYINVVQFIIN